MIFIQYVKADKLLSELLAQGLFLLVHVTVLPMVLHHFLQSNRKPQIPWRPYMSSGLPYFLNATLLHLVSIKCVVVTIILMALLSVLLPQQGHLALEIHQLNLSTIFIRSIKQVCYTLARALVSYCVDSITHYVFLIPTHTRSVLYHIPLC